MIYNEDCRITLARNLSYDYIFCVPPDYSELNLVPIKNFSDYNDFLVSIFRLFNPRKNVVTIAITDRKYNGTIIPKHSMIIDIMEALDWRLISQKIWCKSFNQNLYRLNYSFVMSFARGKVKQYHPEIFEVDLWKDELEKYGGYQFGMAKDVVKRCISNFTEKNDIVYDCFSGSGTTAMASLDLNRNYLGSEISKEFYNLSQERIKNSKNLFVL